MNFGHFYQSFEKSVTFAFIGLIINTQFSLKQPILKTASMVAEATCCLYIFKNYLSNSPDTHGENILITSAIFVGGAYAIYDSIYTLIGAERNYDD